MIEQQGNLFLLSTAHTSLLLRADARAPGLLYLGKKLAGGWENASLLAPEYDGSGGEKPCSLFSAWGGTDFREPSLLLRAEDGSAAADFVLRSAEIAPRTPLEGLPSSYGEETCLRLTYEEKRLGVLLALEFTAYEDSDAFTSSCSLKNEGKSTVTIERFASLQLEFWGKDYAFTTFDGDWGCERQKHTRPLNGGKCENASFTGASSPFRAPFTLLTRAGAAVGVNLVYSGNHRTVAESDDMGRTRLIAGINPFSFSWKLRGGETFFAPEAVFAFGHSEREVGLHMRAFVQEHIIRGVWKKRPRPVLVNNWEGTYFSFTRERILNIARAAKEAGAELFVLDDGWFGRRDDDTTSLGDWTDYEEKTGGIASLAEKVRSLGLAFGIWMEPEMVSEKSGLYKAHPEWAMKIPGREPVRMRHQLMLDLTSPAVQDYLVESVSSVLTLTKAAYLKWDYNRRMTDVFGAAPSGEYYHRYILGLYSVMARLNAAFPDVLFEGCASGGARFDLGILSYMPQIWTSDNTDARERIAIQSGTAACYPQSTMGSHVSASPNHQTGNASALSARFAVAAGGVLGYECDLSALSNEERAAIRDQIVFYKQYREVMQFGSYYPLGDVRGEWAGYCTVSPDKSLAVAAVAVLKKRTGVFNLRASFKGLEEDALYRVSVREGAGTREAGKATGGMLVNGSVRLDGIFEEQDARSANPVFTRMFVFEKI